MGYLKEQFSDWKYYASKENTGGTRGFFLTMAIGFIILGIISVALFVVSCIGITTGVMRTVGFIMPVAAILLLAGFLFLVRDK